ncbi:IS110 family transposase [Arthrobacter rhombi]|uniref:IS110 family transposase n=1 Tax=Arthrobacter rhombi TaxID=71253 RepID=UPI0035692DAE
MLERDLIAHGEPVVRVNTKLMARERGIARTWGKSDPIDALAVARAVVRNPDLQPAITNGPARQVALLLGRREVQVAERTRAVNRLRWHLHELDPELDPPSRSLGHGPAQAKVQAFLGGFEDREDIQGLVAEIASLELEDIVRGSAGIKALDRRLKVLTAHAVPELLEIPGCASTGAAKLMAETAGIARFSTPAKFAVFAGCAPIPAWSGKTEGRMRLNRGGNRQLNCAIHRIAVTQIRLEGPGKDYYEKHRQSGKGKMEALRTLKTQIARTIWKTMTTATRAATETPQKTDDLICQAQAA